MRNTTAAAVTTPNMKISLNSDFESTVWRYFRAATAISRAKTPVERKELSYRNKKGFLFPARFTEKVMKLTQTEFYWFVCAF